MKQGWCWNPRPSDQESKPSNYLVFGIALQLPSVDEWKAGYLSGPAMHLMPQTLLPALMKLVLETGTVHYGPERGICLFVVSVIPRTSLLPTSYSFCPPQFCNTTSQGLLEPGGGHLVKLRVEGKSQIFTQSCRWRKTQL